MRWFIGLMMSALVVSLPVQAKNGKALAEIVADAHRTPSFVARDVYRHPQQTLTFFDVEPNMTVVEIWPARGWYTEILAPYLKDGGQYYAAGFSLTAERTPLWRKKFEREFRAKIAADPDHYGAVIHTGLSVPEDTEIAPAGTADRVLTFRNVHNWMKGGYADGVFEAMFKALKPGGVLGVVEHRAKPGTSKANMIKSGYVTEQHVIKLAEKAGFKLRDKSEINANAKDDADHPKGVWTLPPSLRLKKVDRAVYMAIGESDRMTLKFVKPE